VKFPVHCIVNPLYMWPVGLCDCRAICFCYLRVIRLWHFLRGDFADVVSGVAGEWVVVDAPLSSCSTAACLLMTLCLLVGRCSHRGYYYMHALFDARHEAAFVSVSD
jgi:hypothetical protein